MISSQGPVPAPDCCSPWDNGRFDRRAAQASQLAVGQDWRITERFAADDFWLCEGNVYDIHTIRGQLTTNSDLPKALVLVYSDCDGRPDRVIAIAGLRNTSFDQPEPEDRILLGDVQVSPAGEQFDGLNIINVEASFDKLVLKGGSYWVSIVGYSADLDPLDEFFWGSAGNQTIKGRPGVVNIDDEWLDSDTLCCGCTDYNFCIEGDTCKILIDNGAPLAYGQRSIFPGIPSLQNGQRTADRSRAADQFVLPPCTSYQPCYIEAWLWTNCNRAGLQFLQPGCQCPRNGQVGLGYLESTCVEDTGVSLTDQTGQLVTLKKFQWFFSQDMVPALGGGRPRLGGFNVWLSVFALGDNRQNARGYFALSGRCDRPCDVNFGPGCYLAAPADQSLWRSNGLLTGGRGFDHAFLIAVRESDVLPPPPATTDCPADFNHSGSSTVQDLFDFLAAWFAGCP